MKVLTAALALTRALLIASLAALPFALPQQAFAAATTQTLHAFMCKPAPAVGANGGGRVVNTSSTATTQPSYVLNSDGCALIAAADVGFFLSQGYFYGPSTFVAIQTGITASTTSSTSTITLPAYALITAIILEETAGNSITGGVDIGDATSATTYASAVALGANAIIPVKDSALTRVFANSGVPVADQILVACHSSCNSGSVNISIQYTYY